jgi:uncharacterized protein (DUF2237 family)
MIEAYEAGTVPSVVLEATDESALAIVPMQALLAHAWVQRPTESR